jgi:hypothetical protein
MPAFVLFFLARILADEVPTATRAEHSVQSVGPKLPVGPNAPLIAFEIRELRLGSPDWRGRLLPKLEEMDRREGVAVWAIDEAALTELLQLCQADARSNLVSAPKMVVPVGQPARMTNEETVQYVASIKRHADAAPGQASKVAFEPRVGEVHSGVRVNVLSSRLKGQVLFARVTIDENRLLKLHTVPYTESMFKKVEIESHPGKGPIHDRLHRNIGLQQQAITAQIQVPEVESRRAEGDWLIPSAGALVVSMGPRSRTLGLGLGTAFQEQLIVITARPVAAADPAVKRAAAAPGP